VANFIRYKKEAYQPDRDLIVALTADEETSGESIRWLVTQHRELIEAERLNTMVAEHNAISRFVNVQAAEKVYQSFALEVRNKGGHSSRPVPDNAINHLAGALSRIANYTFPVRLNEVTRAFFGRGAAAEQPALAADMRLVARSGDPAAARRLSAASPYYNSVLHTTCVATRLFAGHADNALPQLARATVNCRIQPDEPVDSVLARLQRLVADTAAFFRSSRGASQPALAIARRRHGTVEARPGSTGQHADRPGDVHRSHRRAHTRNAGIPTYGIAAIFDDLNDSRAHGRMDGRQGIPPGGRVLVRIGEAPGRRQAGELRGDQ
jgi:acetylornithine deacetylase/succinyl-diaminopimelate desuccinylase-like protein